LIPLSNFTHLIKAPSLYLETGEQDPFEMYLSQQSDQGPSANSSKESLETNWNSVALNQKMGFNGGSYGFGPYSIELEERPGLYRSSNG
jgi:hypothetical protein